jgi:hypothetical protein
MTPQELGFLLEQAIHNNLQQKNIYCLREKDIIKKYGKHITGIDHMIIFCDKIILIQAKWLKIKPTIVAINHFIRCVNLIKKNHKDKLCIPLYVSKYEPTLVAI